MKPSHIKQLGRKRGTYAGRLKRSDIPASEKESRAQNDKEEPSNSYIKTWEELDVEIEARMRRDSEVEAFGEKVIEERSAAYPHQSLLDG